MGCGELLLVIVDFTQMANMFLYVLPIVMSFAWDCVFSNLGRCNASSPRTEQRSFQGARQLHDSAGRSQCETRLTQPSLPAMPPEAAEGADRAVSGAGGCAQRQPAARPHRLWRAGAKP